jgi:hypothetical protein
MALTQSAWTETFVNGLYTATCTVISTTAENDAYTKKTPANLNPNLPNIIIQNTLLVCQMVPMV